jgi:hypothetical protein
MARTLRSIASFGRCSSHYPRSDLCTAVRCEFLLLQDPFFSFWPSVLLARQAEASERALSPPGLHSVLDANTTEKSQGRRVGANKTCPEQRHVCAFCQPQSGDMGHTRRGVFDLIGWLQFYRRSVAFPADDRYRNRAPLLGRQNRRLTRSQAAPPLPPLSPLLALPPTSRIVDLARPHSTADGYTTCNIPIKQVVGGLIIRHPSDSYKSVNPSMP